MFTDRKNWPTMDVADAAFVGACDGDRTDFYATRAGVYVVAADGMHIIGHAYMARLLADIAHNPDITAAGDEYYLIQYMRLLLWRGDWAVNSADGYMPRVGL